MATSAAETLKTTLSTQMNQPAPSTAASDPALKELGSQIKEVTSEPLPKAPEPVQMPDIPKGATINPKEWQGLGMGLVAMAMISGAARGNWLAAGHFLNGAIQGYREGNAELAQENYKKYQLEYQRAAEEQRARNQEYRDLLNNRSKSINEMIAQYRVMAAQDNRQDMLAAAQTRNLAEMEKALLTHEDAMAKLNAKNNQAHASMTPDPKMQQQADVLAHLMLSGQHVPFGMLGGKNSDLGRAVLSRLGEIAQENKWSDADLAARIGVSQGALAGFKSGETLRNKSMQAMNTAYAHLTDVDALAAKVGNDAPVFVNKWVNTGQSQFNDPTVNQFIAANEILVNEVAKALNPSGQVTNSGREEVQKVIRTGLSSGSYHAVTQQLRKMLHERQVEIQKTQEAAAAQMQQGDVGTLGTQPAEPAPKATATFQSLPDAKQYPDGTKATNDAGETMVVKNGQWVKQ